VAGAAAVFAADALDPAIQTLADIEQLGLSFMSASQHLSKRKLQEIGRSAAPWDFVSARPLSNFAEAYRAVRTKLLLAKSKDRGTVVLITSALPAEGKTVSSVSLARVMALSGDKTILVDCDLRRNSLRSLTASASRGLVELLEGGGDLSKVIQKDAATDLAVLPLSERSFTTDDKFSDGKMQALLERLRAEYDFVVLDGPPVLAITDAVTLSTLSDKVLMIVKHGQTPQDAVAAAIARLENTPITGVVLTQVKEGAFAAVGRRSSLYYHKTYGSYYME
jgi:capsular exopolysaccharide synthesis family protein